jgi:cell wall-associated NlpC family hydrolase
MAMIVPDGGATALAKGRRPGATKVSSKKHRKGRSHARRSYTRRGNPEVTRTVASQLIGEKLPELAALVGIDVPEGVPAQSPAPDLVALTGTMEIKHSDTYQDSELDESEDPDKISEEDEANLEDLPDDINVFYKEFTKYMATLNSEPTVTDNGVDKQVVMETVMDWLGTRYLFGGVGRDGIDCSAFTGTVYRSLNFRLPRTAAAQWDVGAEVPAEDLQFGDLVFFHTRQAVFVSHVGMYLGNGMFVHASSRNGVTVSSLEADYYATHMIGARRYNLNSVMTAAAAGSGSDISHN